MYIYTGKNNLLDDHPLVDPTCMKTLATICVFITCSAVILYADWSICVRSGAIHTL